MHALPNGRPSSQAVPQLLYLTPTPTPRQLNSGLRGIGGIVALWVSDITASVRVLAAPRIPAAGTLEKAAENGPNAWGSCHPQGNPKRSSGCLAFA